VVPFLELMHAKYGCRRLFTVWSTHEERQKRGQPSFNVQPAFPFVFAKHPCGKNNSYIDGQHKEIIYGLLPLFGVKYFVLF